MSTVLYTAVPEIDYDLVIKLYRRYCDRMKAKGRKPVSFPNFITGKYQK